MTDYRFIRYLVREHELMDCVAFLEELGSVRDDVFGRLTGLDVELAKIVHYELPVGKGLSKDSQSTFAFVFVFSQERADLGSKVLETMQQVTGCRIGLAKDHDGFISESDYFAIRTSLTSYGSNPQITSQTF
jgi:hypothetical protein